MKYIAPILGLILILGIFIYTRNNSTDFLVSTDTEYAYTSPTPTPVAIKKINWQELEAKLNQTIQENTPPDNKWIVGIKITDLKTGEELGINDKEMFDAASVGKLPILLTAYEQIENGTLSREKKITVTEKEMQYYGTGSIQYKKPPLEYTAKELIDLMIKQSDNTASYVMANTVGRDNIKNFAQKIAMNNTDTKENDTVPHDVNILLKHLYTDIQNKDKALYDEIIETMTGSIFEDRLPAKLPKEIKVAHKIGTGTAQIHDAGIVFVDDRPYAISVFTKSINDETKAKALIAELSLVTYQTFSEVK